LNGIRIKVVKIEMTYIRKTLKEGRMDRQCPKCKEYEVDEDGYCQRCGQNTLPPL